MMMIMMMIMISSLVLSTLKLGLLALQVLYNDNIKYYKFVRITTSQPTNPNRTLILTLGC